MFGASGFLSSGIKEFQNPAGDIFPQGFEWFELFFMLLFDFLDFVSDFDEVEN